MKAAVKKLALMMALPLCLGTFITGTIFAAAEAEPAAEPVTESYSLNLPNRLRDADYGYLNETYLDYTAMYDPMIFNADGSYADTIKADAENYGLIPFDGYAEATGEGDKLEKLTYSGNPNTFLGRWHWQFGGKEEGTWRSGIALVVKPKTDGVLTLNLLAGEALGGWIDNYNVMFSASKLSGGSLTRLRAYWEGSEKTGKGEAISSANGAGYAQALTFPIEVKAGDVVFFEIGAKDARNFQKMDSKTLDFAHDPDALPEEPDERVTTTVRFGSIPTDVGNHEFGFVENEAFKYTAMAGKFDAGKKDSGYGLTPFDKLDGKKLSATSKPGILEFSDINVKFANGQGDNSVVWVIEAKKEGTLKFDFTPTLSSATPFTGWMDGWNTIFGVYRENKADGTLSVLRNFYQENEHAPGQSYSHQKDFIPDTKDSGTTMREEFINKILNNTVEVKAGDVVYYEIGSKMDRNIQNIGDATISLSYEESYDATGTVGFVDIPEQVYTNSYLWVNDEGGTMSYTVRYADGWFKEAQEGYNLSVFDGYPLRDNEKVLTASALPSGPNGYELRNWAWYGTENTSFVLLIRSKVDGVIQFNFPAVTGSVDRYNTVFTVHRLNKEGGNLDTLISYHGATCEVGGLPAFSSVDSGDPFLQFLATRILSQKIAVKAGDIVYYEFGCKAARNLQGLSNATFSAMGTIDESIEDYKITGIELDTDEVTKQFETNGTFDHIGLKVYAVYENGDRKLLSEEDYEVSAPNLTEAGTKTVTVTYGEFEAKSYQVEVKAHVPVLERLRLDTAAAQLVFETGDAFNSAGLRVYGIYDDESEQEITSGYTVTAPEDMDTAGTKTVTVTYREVSASYEITVNKKVVNSFHMRDIPQSVHDANYGYVELDTMKYTAMGGLFDENKANENYGLRAFDDFREVPNTYFWLCYQTDGEAPTPGDNKGGATTADFSLRNWSWYYNATSPTSVVFVVESKIDNGTLKFDFTAAAGLNGWMDTNNTLFTVHVKRANGTLETVRNYPFGQHEDLAGNGPSLVGLGGNFIQALGSSVLTMSVAVNTGDIVYYEIGSAGGRSLQNVQEVTVSLKTADPSLEKVEECVALLDRYISTLVEEDYTPEDFTAIRALRNTFVNTAAGKGDTTAIEAFYEETLAAIKQYSPNELLTAKNRFARVWQVVKKNYKEEYYTAENWTSVQAKFTEYETQSAACTAPAELTALFNRVMGELAAIPATKQAGSYSMFPSIMNVNGYNWIEGNLMDVVLYTGSVASGVKNFDSMGSNEKLMYNKELNPGGNCEGDQMPYAEDWKWRLGVEAGVIVAYKAKTDLSFTVTLDMTGGFGWMEQATISYYIVRGGKTKHILNTITNPQTAESYGGTFYLKAGDMLYVEYTCLTGITPGSIRNTQTPEHTAFLADPTGFNAEAYATQNHDLPEGVNTLIEQKTQALRDYYAGLKETDYSATNWLTLEQYIEQFIAACETDVETEEDVTALYEETLANMQAVPTLAQAAEELQAAIEEHVGVLQSEYDKLIAENSYSEENRALLEQALEEGKTAIRAATSKAAANTARLKAVAALKAIPVENGGEGGGGCGAVVSGTAIIAALTLVAAGAYLCLARRKN